MKYCAAIDLGASSGRIAIGAIDQEKLTITEVHRFKHEAKEFEDRGLRWEWAKIVEEVIVIKLSKLVKDSESDVAQIANTASLVNLEAIAQELFGDGAVVEVEKA